MTCFVCAAAGSGEISDSHPVWWLLYSKDSGYLEGRQAWGGEETDPDPVHCSLQAHKAICSFQSFMLNGLVNIDLSL